MSGQCTIWAWRQEIESPTHKLVLLALADIARDNGTLWPSHAYVAKKVGYSERTVRTAVAALGGVGLLTTTPRPGKTDIIRLSLSSITIFANGPEDETQEAGPRGRPKKTPASDVSGRHMATGKVSSDADEPSIEPSNMNQGAIALVVSTDDRSPVQQAFDAYNALAKDIIAAGEASGRASEAATARTLNDVRRRGLNARLKEVGGIEGWKMALEVVRESAFLTGATRHRFGLTLDFLLQPTSFTKLMEGFYSKERTDGNSNAPRDQQRAENFEQGARDAFEKLRQRRGGGSEDLL